MKTTLSLPALMVTLLWLGTMAKCDEDAAGPEVPTAPVEGGGQESAAHVCPMYCLRRPPLCRPPSSLIGGPGCWRCCNIGEYNNVAEFDNAAEPEHDADEGDN